MTSPSFDLSPYNEVEFSFYFYAHSMENNEDFWLQYNDGSGFTTIKTWTRGVDFNNGSFSNKIIVTLNASQYNLVNNAQFRLRCDASGNNDQIFIDQVVIVGDGTSGSARGTTNKILSIPEDEVVVLEKNNFKLYPNPVKGAVLNIKLSSGNNNISYKIINMLGQVVNVGKTTKEVMVGNLEAGVYYIEVNNGKEKMTKRFVKSN
nr:T9SS type A sorting domain-containing protein [Gaetbulibacter sp. 4G1]